MSDNHLLSDIFYFMEPIFLSFEKWGKEMKQTGIRSLFM